MNSPMTKFAIMRANREKRQAAKFYEEPGLEALWESLEAQRQELGQAHMNDFLHNWDGRSRQ